ncbi:putative quinol monooxygenase [Streptomyces sp. NPDC048550]|uniref:putative quinol monooxygenase n=1 Tax=unclassified Streptomyces TaxID=2593676 RepID=UPI002E145EE0|nr:putative quinol monooxygenase [Streptomyces sp. NBC_01296]WSW57424.1 antibiotic biosynthesis monooxygenase [Streptomyces sp. NBC_00998]
MSTHVDLVILISALPGRGREQVEAFERLAPLVRAEEGCLRYDLHAVAGDPDRFVLIERWASREAIAAHDVSPHMVAADAANSAFRAGPAEVIELAAATSDGR